MLKLHLALLALTLAITPLPAHTPAATPKSATKSTKPKPPAPPKPAPLVPLTDRERAIQLLNRFTFGPRPGEVERVLAQTPEAWFEQQLNPATINDDALNRRLNDYATI